MHTDETGVNWAIVSHNAIDYLPHELAATEEEAESLWRKMLGISPIECSIRRTTVEEDRRLEQRESRKPQHQES